SGTPRPAATATSHASWSGRASCSSPRPRSTTGPRTCCTCSGCFSAIMRSREWESRRCVAPRRGTRRRPRWRPSPRDSWWRWLAPDDAAAVQLALFPVLLAMGRSPTGTDLDAAAALLALAVDAPDPKADALVGLLAADPRKTIVFAEAVTTVRHLLRRLGGSLRVAAVVGDAGFFGPERVRRSEVLAAFAPLAQGATPPPAALRADVLLATDLVGEGLN